MASTDVSEHPLTLEHLPGALVLTQAAHWNQNAGDWRHLLGAGVGRGISLPDGSLAATTVVLPYDGGFGWISMVLVAPEQRRRGFATRLLRWAIDELQRRRLTPVLDATPAGREVYVGLGFTDTWGFTRYRRDRSAEAGGQAHAEPGADAGELTVRPLAAADWPAIAAIDRPAFGADRLPLLQSLARRLPAAALVAQRRSNERLAGYVLGRDGRESSQLGPLLADDGGAARALLAAATERVPGPLYVDLADARSELVPQLQRAGFTVQRPFMRMALGRTAAPGDPKRTVLVAGPELG